MDLPECSQWPALSQTPPSPPKPLSVPLFQRPPRRFPYRSTFRDCSPSTSWPVSQPSSLPGRPHLPLKSFQSSVPTHLSWSPLPFNSVINSCPLFIYSSLHPTYYRNWVSSCSNKTHREWAVSKQEPLIGMNSGQRENFYNLYHPISHPLILIFPI